MSDKEKIAYFDNHIQEIFSHPNNMLASFVLEIKDKANLKHTFHEWPVSIKIKVVDDYLSFYK